MQNYRNLYSSRDDFLSDVDPNTLIDWEVPKLTEEESKVLEGKLKYDEIENVTKNYEKWEKSKPSWMGSQ